MTTGNIQGCGIFLDEIDIHQEIDVNHFLCNLLRFVTGPAVDKSKVRSCDRTIPDGMEFCIREPGDYPEPYCVFH